jgi:hypothetical protein
MNDDTEAPPCDDAIWLPDPRGPLGMLARFEHHWKYGPQLYWYVTRPLWWARWRVWSWRYWRAVSLLERSGMAFTAGDDFPEGDSSWPMS